MTVDVKDKKRQEIDKEKKTRKSFVVQQEKKIKVKIKHAVKSSISFPTEEYRLAITETYKKYGFTTLQSYIKALLDLALKDKEVNFKLIEQKIKK